MENPNPTDQHPQTPDPRSTNPTTDIIADLDKQLEALDLNPKPQTPDPNPQPYSQIPENEDDMDLLNDCLTGANEKLNLTADEKDDLEDLDDEQIQKEYEEFMKNIASNTNANDFLGQLNKLMEAGLKGDGNLDADFGNILGGLDEGNDFDMFTDNLIDQFIDKEVIYEPLKEARQKVDEHIAASSNNRTEKNLKILEILNNIISLMDKDLQKTPEGKEKIMQLFEDLQDQGGLPAEIVKASVHDNPEMAKLQQLTQNKGCTIF